MSQCLCFHTRDGCNQLEKSPQFMKWLRKTGFGFFANKDKSNVLDLGLARQRDLSKKQFSELKMFCWFLQFPNEQSFNLLFLLKFSFFTMTTGCTKKLFGLWRTLSNFFFFVRHSYAARSVPEFSVTRWLDYLFNIQLFTVINICPIPYTTC